MPLRHPAALLATWFGIGLIPIAPGTWGSLAAVACAWPIRTFSGNSGLALAFAIVFAAGCWAAGVVAKAGGARDPGAIVIDEVAGQWLALLAAPGDFTAWLLAFLLFRLFDIWKPWPVRWLERHVAGGLGIMLDDLLAAGYVLPLPWVLQKVGKALGVLG